LNKNVLLTPVIPINRDNFPLSNSGEGAGGEETSRNCTVYSPPLEGAGEAVFFIVL